MNRSARMVRVLVWLLVLSLAGTGQLSAGRTVAVGDIHGAYDQFVSILQTAGLIDKDKNWTGGKTVLVQTGDVLDRGPQSRNALDLIMDLTEKAARQEGEVRSLLGNHETMVMMGDLRYVPLEEYSNFATADSEQVRQAEFENYAKFKKQRASKLRQPAPAWTETDKKAWLAAHPPGYFEFRQAFAPKGKYGAWLRNRDAVTQVGEVIFLHGGLSPASPLKSIKEINDRVHREIAQLDDIWAQLAKRNVIWQYMNMEEARAEARAEFAAIQSGGDNGAASLVQAFLNLGTLNIVLPDGPLWYRGYAQEPDTEFTPKLDQVLKKFKIRHVVVGHTVSTSRRITPRYDGRVFMIDTGMLAYFQGRPSALEINDGHFKAFYVGEDPKPLMANADGKWQ
ncbi:MAG: metallophosphoesterase [Acidobacteria bacterium]|nr:metallophosphoesterase [Acidobacteriota bacterium]